MSGTLYWSTAGEEQARLCGPVNGAPRGRRGGESRLETDCGAQHRKHRTAKMERGEEKRARTLPGSRPTYGIIKFYDQTPLSRPVLINGEADSQSAPTASNA